MAIQSKISLTTNQLNSLREIANNNDVSLHHSTEKALISNGLINKDNLGKFSITSQGKKYLEKQNKKTKTDSGKFAEFDRPVFIKHCDLVPNPDQPRQYYKPQGLSELVASIMQVGYLNNKTLIVSLITEGKYQGKYKVIGGNRRAIASAWAFQYLNQGYKYEDIPHTYTDDLLDKLILKYDHADYPKHQDRELPCFVISDSTDVDLIAFLDNLNYEEMPELDQAVFLHKKLDKEYLDKAKNIYQSDPVKQESEIAKLVSRKSAIFTELRQGKNNPKLLATYLLKRDFGFKSIATVNKLLTLAIIPQNVSKECVKQIKQGCYNQHIVTAIADIIQAKQIENYGVINSLISQGLLLGTKVRSKNDSRLVPLDLSVTQAKAKITELYDILTNNIDLKEVNLDVLPSELKDIAYYCNRYGMNTLGKILRDNADYITQDKLQEFAIAASELTYEKDDQGNIHHKLYSRSEMSKLIKDKFQEFISNLDNDEVDRDTLESATHSDDHPNKARHDQLAQEVAKIDNMLVNQKLGIINNLKDIDPDNLASIYKHLDRIITHAKALKDEISKERSEVLELN